MSCAAHEAAPIPDDCFACKMDYMRASASPIVHFPKHWDTSGPTDRYKKQELYADARRAGKELEKA